MNIKTKISIILVSILTLFIAGCSVEESSNVSSSISNFEECSQAGGIVRELFPAECEINGEVFRQEVELDDETSEEEIDAQIDEIIEETEFNDEDVEIGELI